MHFKVLFLSIKNFTGCGSNFVRRWLVDRYDRSIVSPELYAFRSFVIFLGISAIILHTTRCYAMTTSKILLVIDLCLQLNTAFEIMSITCRDGNERQINNFLPTPQIYLKCIE